MASDLVTSVRNLHYNSQVKVFRAFYKFIIKGDIWGDMFLERFEESYGNISFDGGEVDPDTFEWYTLNDFDNALFDLDYNDPMSFFDVAQRLEAVIACEEGTEINHLASGCQIRISLISNECPERTSRTLLPSVTS